MGTTSSSPAQPPLIALNGGSFGKHNNILIPPEAFAHRYGKHGRYARNKYSQGQPGHRRYEDRERPRGRPRARSWEAGSEIGEMRPRRGGLRGRRPGRAAGLRGGMGMDGLGMGIGYSDMGGMGMGAGVSSMPVYYDPRGVKAMSAPDLPMEYAPPLRATRGVKPMMPGMPMEPGMMPGHAYPAGMQNPDPYAYPQQAGPVSYQPQMLPRRQKPKRTQRLNASLDDIAYGAHIARPQAPPAARRRATEPPVSRQMNRTQPPGKRGGPPGNEWLDGNSWLDACTCTTNCHCRKGARVLYRAQEGIQGDDGEHQNRFGEIRYIIKDDLGKDCGDHSKCRAHDSDEDSSDGGRKKGKKKEKKGKDESCVDVNKMREEMAGLRNDIANMKLGGGPVGAGVGAGVAPGMGLGPGMMGQFDPRAGLNSPPGGMLSQGGFPGRMNGVDPRMDPRVDPRVAQMAGGDPFGMELSPNMPRRMGGNMMRRPGRMLRVGRGPMEMMSDPDLEDDMPFQGSDGIVPGMMVDEMDMPPPIRNIRGRWPPKPRGGRGGRRVGHPPRGPPPDFDPHFEYPPLARGGGHMNRPSGRPGNRPPGRPGNRPPPPGYDPDGESDIGLGGAPSRPFHPMHDEDDDDFPPTSGFPGMGGNHGMPPPPRHSPLRRGRGGHGSMDDGPLGNERPRPHQAQVEDDPEGMS